MQTFLSQNTESKWRAVAHKFCLVNPSVFSNWVSPSVSTFFLSSTEPKLICARVLLLCFALIHHRGLSVSVLWLLFCKILYCLDWGKPGTESFDRKRPSISEALRQDFIIKLE